MRGNFLHARRDVVALPDGSESTREYVVHPGAVMVVPLLEDATGAVQLVLERQFRYPLGRVMVEFPAGKLDPGEDLLHKRQTSFTQSLETCNFEKLLRARQKI